MSRSSTVSHLRAAEPQRPEITDPVHRMAIDMVAAGNREMECDEAEVIAKGGDKRSLKDSMEIYASRRESLANLITLGKASTMPGALAQLIQLYAIGSDAMVHSLNDDEKAALYRKFRTGCYSLVRTLEQFSDVSANELGATQYMSRNLDPNNAVQVTSVQGAAA